MCSSGAGAGRCSRPRTPCMCSSSAGAGRRPTPRTPCSDSSRGCVGRHRAASSARRLQLERLLRRPLRAAACRCRRELQALQARRALRCRRPRRQPGRGPPSRPPPSRPLLRRAWCLPRSTAELPQYLHCRPGTRSRLCSVPVLQALNTEACRTLPPQRGRGRAGLAQEPRRRLLWASEPGGQRAPVLWVIEFARCFSFSFFVCAFFRLSTSSGLR